MDNLVPIRINRINWLEYVFKFMAGVFHTMTIDGINWLESTGLELCWPLIDGTIFLLPGPHNAMTDSHGTILVYLSY